MALQSTTDVAEALERLNADGYVVLERLLSTDTVLDMRDRVERMLVHEREHSQHFGRSQLRRFKRKRQGKNQQPVRRESASAKGKSELPVDRVGFVLFPWPAGS